MKFSTNTKRTTSLNSKNLGKRIKKAFLELKLRKGKKFNSIEDLKRDLLSF